MGAQVIVAVRHDKLHDIKHSAMRALDGMVSETDLIPRHFEVSPVDSARRYETGDGSSKQGIVASQYHDMDSPSVLLVTDSLLCSIPQLIGIGKSNISSFSDVSRFIKGQIQKRRYPFSRARDKHTLEEGDPAPLLPASSTMISLFSYYTDTWDWSSQRGKAEECLADLISFCRTGEAARRTFGFYNNQGGFDGNRLTPLATYPSHLMAFVSLHMGSVDVSLVPGREMALAYDSLGIDLSCKGASYPAEINNHVFQALMRSHGLEHRCTPVRGMKDLGKDFF